MAIRTKFGKRLHADRRAAGLTQEQLAKRAGVHPSYVSKFETGERIGGRSDAMDTVIRFAQALGQPTQEYLILAGHYVPEGEPTFQELVMSRTDLNDDQKRSLIVAYDELVDDGANA